MRFRSEVNLLEFEGKFIRGKIKNLQESNWNSLGGLIGSSFGNPTFSS
jgi:hypothetical protein